MAESFRKKFRWLFLGVTLLSLVWVAYALRDALPQLVQNLPKMDIIWFCIGLLLNIFATYIVFEAFYLISNQIAPGVYDRKRMANLYFTGQLMKHLPGRVLGVAYQISVASRIDAYQWVTINAAYMALSTAFALWVALCVVGFAVFRAGGIFIFLMGAIFYFLCWNVRLFLKFRTCIQKYARIFLRIANALHVLASSDFRLKARLAFIFWFSWLIYIVSWVGYAAAWPGLSPVDGVWLCGTYTLAWFIGYISIISPSGLGVREVVFLYLSKDFPPDAIAMMAVMGRITLLICDLVLGSLFIFQGNRDE